MLREHLIAEIATLNAFVELLQEEQRTLERLESPDALGKIALKKIDLGKCLQEQDQAQAQFVIENFPGEPFESVMRSTPEIISLWSEIVDLSTRAGLLNQQNGLMISLYSDHNQAALNCMNAAVASASSDLYDARGKRVSKRNTLIARG